MAASKCPRCEKITDFALESCIYCGYSFDPLWAGVNEYLQWLKENTEVEPLDGDENQVAIVFPHMVDATDSLVLIIEKEKSGGYYIHDGGFAIDHLGKKGYNIAMGSSLMKQIYSFCKSWGVTMNADVIAMESTRNDLGVDLHRLIVVMMVVVNLMDAQKVG